MTIDSVKLFNADNFESEVIQSRRPVLVCFHHHSQTQCDLDEVAMNIGSMASVGKVELVDGDRRNGELLIKYEVKELPTCLLFYHGHIAQRYPGSTEPSVLYNHLEALALTGK